ncbi:MAG TPA: helix-turn-helix domain-containing protein [Polyangiales bacterium]|nr:helix-turn-helix domain-containing protein [Polyangiales bacterium]
MPCPIAQALDTVGEAWCLLILRELFLGFRRFQELEQRLGITASTLTRRLNELTRRGLVEARVYSERPTRSEYVLTAMGEDLLPVILALGAWGNRWLTRAIVPVDAETATPVEPVLVDRRSGRELKLGKIALAAGPDAPKVVRQQLAVPRLLRGAEPTPACEVTP